MFAPFKISLAGIGFILPRLTIGPRIAMGIATKEEVYMNIPEKK